LPTLLLFRWSNFSIVGRAWFKPFGLEY
jgi:hypothetical protein